MSLESKYGRERARVLIVDDERFNVDVLNGFLKEQYEIMVAMSGEQALVAARSAHMPDLILLDIMMPNMDGYEVCRQLKDDPKTKNIPVIFVTAMNRDDDETKGFELGAVDYITKPVNFTITHARIKTHIELKFQRDYLANLSLKDGITGVSNRRRFDKGFERAHENAIKSQKSLSLLMIDIDFFKQYNDYHGYLTGDDVLKTVATTIEEAIESMFNRTENLVARLDGKRFVCMLPNVAYEQMNSAGQLIINSVRSLNIHHELSTVSDVLTVSIGGVSFVPNRGDRLEDAIEGADEMLYRAKEQGRNRLSI